MTGRSGRGARVAVLLAVVAGMAGPSPAMEVADVSFPDRLVVREVALDLHEAALLRYRIVFKVYVAALYLGRGVRPERLFADVPKRLEIEYLRGFTAEQFRESTLDGIARNVARSTLEALRPRIERLATLYRDVAPGDRYALTYLPGVGTELALNGRPLGVIEGADFGAAVFKIWFGEVPFQESLKRALLDGKE